jgi:hypothetical protein
MGKGSLNLYVAIVGASGAGKDIANDAALDAISFPEISERLIPRELGSGQGVTSAFVEHIPKPRKSDSKANDDLTNVGDLPVEPKSGVRQHSDKAMLNVAEIDNLRSHVTQSGSIILPTLTSAWMAQDIGGLYKDKSKDLPVEKHKYRLCMRMNVQPARASIVLDPASEALGFPQRVLFLPATDSRIPDISPEVYNSWSVKLPIYSGDSNEADNSFCMPDYEADISIKVCQKANDEIRADHLAKGRGTDNSDPLDSHILFMQLKTAAAFALLDGRLEITDEDWSLAAQVIRKSQYTRAKIKRVLKALGRDGEKAKRKEAVSTAQAVKVGEYQIDEIKHNKAVERVSLRLLEKIPKEGILSGDLITKIAYRDREAYFADAIDSLLKHGKIREETEMRNSTQSSTRYFLV